MKSYEHVSEIQRHQIEVLLDTGLSKKAIAEKVGIHRSSLYRELNRNSQRQIKGNCYKASFAQHLSKKRKQIRNRYQKRDYAIQRRIIWLLKCKWSPEQIVNVCKQRKLPMLSIEAIYQWIYDQKKQGTDYTHLLRRRHRKRRKRLLSKQPRCIIKNKTSIEQRPDVVEQQIRTGDLEMDLVKCKTGYLLTITDRLSLFNLIQKIPDKRAESVRKAVLKMLSPYLMYIHTITTDNGTEFAKHESIARDLDVEWYFAHPYCSWERGCNENQNGLIRQYASRKTDLDEVDEQTILGWQKQLNHRPRKKLSYRSPIDIFANQSSVALKS